ncbi:hypothetical protein PR202_ga07189 [Eleusine coracana subsp. coracana]|uniref:Cystatin domain-containing protein n=1 Tax=Eleusine coracana subsp. coracana TaxID=191504 RepID=A0AAV5BWY2_ELECO|nr:hypothetical protein QOZ80_2AG0109350 [Eleusine coracana subsp. coracana]GJM90868.1 hypothetical protein PR202_ga07189 [Eleusine coracana subsp. coracana]
MRSVAAVLVPFVVMLALATVGSPGASAALPGVPPTSAPWVTIGDIRNNFYRQIGNFALLMRRIVFREDISLVEVVSGSTQAAGAGFNYRLLLRVADGEGSIGRYQVVVWGVPKSRDWTWKVVSFNRVAGN